jgi:hypothetical protein
MYRLEHVSPRSMVSPKNPQHYVDHTERSDSYLSRSDSGRRHGFARGPIFPPAEEPNPLHRKRPPPLPVSAGRRVEKQARCFPLSLCRCVPLGASQCGWCARNRREHDTSRNAYWKNKQERGMDSSSLRRRESVPPRRASLEISFAVSASSATSDAPMERKTSPRPNQDEVDRGEGGARDADAHGGDELQAAGSTEVQRSAVESAADALLQRLRLRARVAKPPTPRGGDRDAYGEDGDNQETAFPLTPQPEPPASPQGLPPPCTLWEMNCVSQCRLTICLSSTVF